MMTIMTFFFYVAAHIAFLMIGLLVFLMIRSGRKQSEDKIQISRKNKARAIAIAVILVFMGIFLVAVRSDNKEIIELHAESVHPIDVTVYWDRYNQAFTFEREKWTSLWMKTRNDWMDFDTDTFMNDRSDKWYDDNVAFTIKKRLTPLEWLAATDYSSQMFYIENDTGMPILMNFDEYFYCQKKDFDAIIEYYDDLDHYYFMRNDRKLDDEGQKIFHELKKTGHKKSVTPEWLNSDKDWKEEGVREYHVDIMSNDRNLDASITIAKRDGKYYLVGTRWLEGDKGYEFNVRRIPDKLAEKIRPYLK